MDTDRSDLSDDAEVADFCMDVTEVTEKEYAACVAGGQCSAEHLGEHTTDGKSFHRDARCNFASDGKGDHPINCVDWAQAATYCSAHHERLPTEEEWEWAARGGRRGWRHPWGESRPDGQLCWSGVTERNGTCSVGSFPAGDSPEGIHDLAGNVWEWTSSKFVDTAAARVIRGGSWGLLLQGYVSASDRVRAAPVVRRSNLGFRCAVSLGWRASFPPTP
jgi:sulfatase modifying factor 1